MSKEKIIESYIEKINNEWSYKSYFDIRKIIYEETGIYINETYIARVCRIRGINNNNRMLIRTAKGRYMHRCTAPIARSDRRYGEV